MALDPGDYVTEGLMRAADGALRLVTYNAAVATTYYRQNGFLLDAEGRLVVVIA